MATTVTLKAIFASNKAKLSESLKGLTLPKDAQQIQKIVTDFLSDMFENNGEYRQSLTESEDYILQAALRLLQAQQSITNEIVKSSISNDDHNVARGNRNAVNPYYALVGTGVGALAGGLAGTWGAVAGAIAGTAIVIYCSAKKQAKTSIPNLSAPSTEPHVNGTVFTDIVENICQSIDSVIETYRVQVKRIKDVYENREKPTLQTDYSELLDQVVNVYNVLNTSSEAVSPKISNAVNSLVECLENYGLKIENGKVVNE